MSVFQVKRNITLCAVVKIDCRQNGFVLVSNIIAEKMTTSLKIINDNQTLEKSSDGKHNVFREYYWNKQLCLETTYIGKQKNGYMKKWYPSGVLKKYIDYTDDKKNGMFQRWYDNGQLLLSGEFSNGKRIGTWKYLKKDGSVYHERIFERRQKN